MSAREEQKYQCTGCSYATNYEDHFIVHGRRHAGQLPYQCDQCTLAFSQKCDLLEHQRMHPVEKPFQCDQCSFASMNWSKLLRHYKSHTEEKPFQCDQCSFASTNLSNVIQHVSTHKGKKSFKCDECDYTSTIKDNWKSHIERHARIVQARLASPGFPGNQSGASTSQDQETVNPTPSQLPQLDIPRGQMEAKDPVLGETDTLTTGYFTANVSAIDKDSACEFVDPVPNFSVANLQEQEYHPTADNEEGASDEWDTPIKTLFGAEYERL